MRIGGSAIKTLLVVALACGAIVLAAMNLKARMHAPPVPDDGVVWVDRDAGVTAFEVRSESPAWNAGIREGQVLRYIYHDGAWEEIHRADDVGYYLDDAGLGGSLVYEVE